jgi:hypothetical protein
MRSYPIKRWPRRQTGAIGIERRCIEALGRCIASKGCCEISTGMYREMIIRVHAFKGS